MNSWIAAESHAALLAVILSGVAASIYLEQNFRWAAKASAPVLAIMLAMILSNLHVMPTEAPVYDVVTTHLVPAAVELLLFRADVRKIFSLSGGMIVTFHVATLGTILGTFVSAATLRPWLTDIPEIGGMMSASYIGGGVNFIAVKQTYQAASQTANPLLVADNFVMAGVFLLLLVIADRPFFRRRFPHPHSLEADQQDARTLAAQHWRPKPIGLLDIALALAVAFTITAVSSYLAALAGEQLGRIGELAAGGQITRNVLRSLGGSIYVWVTLLALTGASLFPSRLQRVAGAEELGGYLLHVFLFVIGLPAELTKVFLEVPAMFAFCLLIAMINLGFTLAVGWLFRLNLEELLLAVNATLGGAPSAAAMAVSKGWSRLVLPGVLTGVWGYVIGTAIGICVAESLRVWFH